MNLRFISPRLHSVLDYTAAVALIVLPFVLDLAASSPAALWLSVGGGIGLVIYSLVTDYAFEGGKILSYSAHLAFDLVAAAAFIAAPFVFDWNMLTTTYYLLMGGGVLVVVACSATRQSARARQAGSFSH